MAIEVTELEPHRAPERATFWEKLGPGGLATLVLALATGVLGLGIPILLRLMRVLRASGGEVLRPADAILVLGRRLENNGPSEVFEARLAHAAELWRGGWAPRLIVAGGLTGTASLSEAQAGRAWLESHGIPAEIILAEDRSQHTLENLYNVRELLRERGWTGLILVSDPLHLARAGANARNLGLEVACSPASACSPRKGSPGWWGRLAFEGFLLHWYLLGVAYSRLIRSRAQLARVT